MMPTTASRDDWATPLASLVAALRPDWDFPGIRAAIHKARHRGTPLEVATALLRLAARPRLTTPAMLTEDGNHWGTPTIIPTPTQARCDVTGHEHELLHGCRLCAGDAKGDPAPLVTLKITPDQAGINTRGAALVRAAIERTTP